MEVEVGDRVPGESGEDICANTRFFNMLKPRRPRTRSPKGGDKRCRVLVEGLQGDQLNSVKEKASYYGILDAYLIEVSRPSP